MKPRTSGNGTNNRQWCYIMFHFPFILICKLGISGNKDRRAKEISEKVFGWAIPVFGVKIPFAYSLEQAMHKLFSVANVRLPGFGKEWFWLPIAPIALAIMLTAFLLEWLLYILIALVISWFWAGRPTINL